MTTARAWRFPSSARAALLGIRLRFAVPCLGAVWLVFAAVTGNAQSLQPIPRLESRVTDLTGTLTAEQQSALDQKLASFEAAKGAQLAVLIVPTTEPEAIEQYSIRVVDQWKLGRKNVDDGALLIVAKNDHTLRIEVGRGLEGALTDATSNRIITETIVPLFRQGDFYGGISAGVDQIIRVVNGEALPPPDHRWQGGAGPEGRPVFPLLFTVVLVGAVVLQSLFGRALGSLLTGAGAGFLILTFGYALALAVLGGIGAFILSMIFGLSGTRGWSSYPRSGGWGGGWGGFGGGGWGGSGRGGGFSGGGGGFAGGGASGRW